MAMHEEFDSARGGGGGVNISSHGGSLDVPAASNRVLSVRFNQDYGCFACGLDAGFRIYNCDPFKETFRREFDNGGIGLVETLHPCNILALVGGGAVPRYPPNKIMIWDYHQRRCIGELSFRSDVRAVRLRRDRIVAVLEYKIYVYNFADLKLLDHIKTIENPKGLCALSPSSNSCVLACPGLLEGQVRVEHYSLKRKQLISAHDSSLACFALTTDGRLLATASVKGTLVRIFNTHDGTPLQELRRGAKKAEIFSIVFSFSAHWLALTSDKKTVHVFKVNTPAAAEGDLVNDNSCLVIPEAETKASNFDPGSGVPRAIASSSPSSPVGNTGSSLSFMKGVLPSYFSSERSFAHYRLPKETHAIVAFGSQDNTVIIVGTDGSFYRCLFDPVHGGDMVQQEFTKFLRPDKFDVP